MDRLKDRVAVITGASSGLGRATALRFATEGAKIICADLEPSSPTCTSAEINTSHGPDTATFIACDVTSEPSIQNLVHEAVSWGGRIDILCNYAGVAMETNARNAMSKRCHDFSTDDFDLTMGVNLRGTYLCCKYVLGQMLQQQPEPTGENRRGERGRGWIVNAASILGLVAHPNTPGYTTSKFAVVGLTKQLALDYAVDKIHVNCLCPGFVKSPMIQTFLVDPENAKELAAAHPWNALGTPEDVASAALFLCSDESAWVTGHALTVDGGYTIR